VELRRLHSNRTSRMLGICVTTLVICLASIQAQAHKVNVFAYVEGDRVVVEGYFSASVKAQGCTVEVLDESGKRLQEGRTDPKGIYSFKLADLPAFTGGLKIVLDVGEGHKTEYILDASDIPGSRAKNASSREQPSKNEPSQKQSLNANASSAADSTQVVDQAALMVALDALLDKKLEPIVRMLGKQEKLLLEEKYGGPRMSDIIGGIGWIMGIIGLTAFFWGRNRSAKKSFE
jgi:nickel transport protein